MIDTTKRWQVIQGDCLEVLRELPDGCVDAVVTDPPYSSGGQFRGDRAATTSAKYQQSDAKKHPDFTGDNRDQRSWTVWCSEWLRVGLDKTKPGGMCAVFVDWRQLPSLTDAIQMAGWVWRGVAVWDKKNGRPVPNRFSARAEFVVWGTKGPRPTSTEGAKYAPGVIQCTAPKDRCHSTQKPVELLERMCEVCAPESGIVLDPFVGSGTTGVAAVNIGRRFVGLEVSDHFADIARERIAEAEADFLNRENTPIEETA